MQYKYEVGFVLIFFVKIHPLRFKERPTSQDPSEDAAKELQHTRKGVVQLAARNADGAAAFQDSPSRAHSYLPHLSGNKGVATILPPGNTNTTYKQVDRSSVLVY